MKTSHCSVSQLQTVKWITLPHEIWLQIFKNIPQMTLLFVVRQVCRLFHKLVFDFSLWKSVDMNEWKTDANLQYLHLTKTDKLNSVPQEIDLNCVYNRLYKKGFVTSSELFVPVLNRVHAQIKAISFSRYGGDFVFEIPQQHILNKCSNLTYLNVAFCDDINSVTIKSICQHCSYLQTFILEGCSKVNDDALKEIQVLYHLERLSIAHCAAITDEGIHYLTLMPARLKMLLCDGVLHISDIALVILVKYQSQIENFSLDGEELHDETVKEIITNLVFLKSLEISFCNNLTDQSFYYFVEHLESRLNGLHLRKLSTRVTTPVITQLFGQDNMSLLKHLTLTDCEAVQDQTLHAISIMCKFLEDIQLDWCCEVTDSGIKMLITKCRNLSRMIFVGLKRLRGLWLSDLEIFLPHLTYLDVTECDAVNDEELFALVKRKIDLVAYTYFHEKVTINNVDELEGSQSAATNQQSPDTEEPPCPASQGASIDF